MLLLLFINLGSLKSFPFSLLLESWNYCPCLYIYSLAFCEFNWLGQRCIYDIESMSWSNNFLFAAYSLMMRLGQSNVNIEFVTFCQLSTQWHQFGTALVVYGKVDCESQITEGKRKLSRDNKNESRRRVREIFWTLFKFNFLC